MTGVVSKPINFTLKRSEDLPAYLLIPPSASRQENPVRVLKVKFNLLLANVLFLNPLKISENLWFPDIFRVCKKERFT